MCNHQLTIVKQYLLNIPYQNKHTRYISFGRQNLEGSNKKAKSKKKNNNNVT